MISPSGVPVLLSYDSAFTPIYRCLNASTTISRTATADGAYPALEFSTKAPILDPATFEPYAVAAKGVSLIV